MVEFDPLMVNPAAYPIRYTLCFLTRGEEVLMLHRHNPPNQGLWNGVGGRLEPGESPRDSVIREVREETGFRVNAVHFSGLLTWDGFETPPGGLYIFTAEAPDGDAAVCPEGTLAWKPRDWVFTAPEVVSNIHVFAPLVFADGDPRHFHFSYRDGEIDHYEINPLPAPLCLMGSSF